MQLKELNQDLGAMSRFRFDAARWNEAWFRNLSVEAKMLHQYIMEFSNLAGIWRKDLDAAGLAISSYVDEKLLDDLINAGIIIKLNDPAGKHDDVYWMKRKILSQHSFLSLQFGGHKSILYSLRRFKLLEDPDIMALFPSAEEFKAHIERKKIKKQAIAEKSSSEYKAFNVMASQGVPMKWDEWKSLCSMYPKMNKPGVMQALVHFVPLYLEKFIRVDRKKSTKIWRMAVDIAEKSDQGIEYADAHAVALIAYWRDKRKQEARKRYESWKLSRQ